MHGWRESSEARHETRPTDGECTSPQSLDPEQPRRQQGGSFLWRGKGVDGRVGSARPTRHASLRRFAYVGSSPGEIERTALSQSRLLHESGSAREPTNRMSSVGKQLHGSYQSNARPDCPCLRILVPRCAVRATSPELELELETGNGALGILESLEEQSRGQALPPHAARPQQTQPQPCRSHPHQPPQHLAMGTRQQTPWTPEAPKQLCCSDRREYISAQLHTRLWLEDDTSFPHNKK
ncbi:hypothetical protein B0T25DRAFT_332831 [Lasiosphaeria hispida]|uniref:Uncharacterized protein n=1 Tax=Lasiosphaeria hispida TaxID=260671 RepID=A0AAJ0M7W8_9PEZI|nr:hypothetical protein B0T25DRAFT_332831 [Lasiosphaeria hispida]